jgi:predicted esterase
VPRWDNLALVPEISEPVYIVHGVRDVVIPSSKSLRLAAALIARRNVVVTRYDARANHNTVPLHFRAGRRDDGLDRRRLGERRRPQP